MEFRILGPLEVLDQGRVVTLGGRMQQSLLALLLLHPNERISVDRLIDELWAEQLPLAADRSLQVQISRLRKTLLAAAGHSGDAPPGVIDGAVLINRNRGYELRLDRDCLDAWRFRQLIAEGKRELDRGHAQRAAGAFERALDLWRGRPLSDVADSSFAQSEINELNELRFTALEHRIDLDLELGRHSDVVGRLSALTHEARDGPLRERLRAQHMLALYRCDRQADALQVYEDTRQELNRELGIQPGQPLRDLHRQILVQDPALLLPVTNIRPPPSTDRVVPAGATHLVTVVVANIAGSITEPLVLSSQADPLDASERQYDVIASRAAACADALDQHGGTLATFDGDTVVGVFGLDSLHEDDALRAVRAAADIRSAGASAIGISSGKVYIGPGARGETFATGEVKLVASRLKTAAEDGEILLSHATHRLVANDVVTEELEPRRVPGQPARVQAHRLLRLRSDGLSASLSATPFIGRERERRALRDQLALAIEGAACCLVTVIGPPGIGKSRLAQNFVEEIAGEADVVIGRCPAYGVAARPLTEIVSQLSGGDPREGIPDLLEGHDPDGLIRRGVLSLIGLTDDPFRDVDASWAMRRLLEEAARRQPLVVVIDDAHCAGPALLDLLEHVAAFSTGSPILIVCLARSELLETRPGWAVPQEGRSMVVLDALPGAEARNFVETLASGELEQEVAERIVDTADGNPLFLEQLVAFGAEPGLTTLPATIEAVLAARIAGLETNEREVLLHAAVEGRRFHRGALVALMAEEAPDATRVALMGLLRKQLIHLDRPELPGEEAFRFTHVLIRDVAYDAMRGRRRADLHQRLAEWLKTKPGVSDEILGYHLEQVYMLRGGLESDREVADEAATLLTSAARAALVRGDAAARAGLLERATALREPEHPERLKLVSDLGGALIEAGRLKEAERFLKQAIDGAQLRGNVCLEARARVDRELVGLHTGRSGGYEHARRAAEAALADLERHGDDPGQSRAWALQARIDWLEGCVETADHAWERAARHARRAGDDEALFEALGWRASAAVFGPTPVPEAILRCEQIRKQAAKSRMAVAFTLHPLGLLHAMTGDFEAARELAREANAVLDGLGRMDALASHHEAFAEMLAGRPDLAERRLRPGYEKLKRMEEREQLVTTAALLARAVYAQERLDEAEDLCDESQRIAEGDDVVTHVMRRGIQARLLARRGDAETAVRLAREAVRLADSTDLYVVRADALVDLEDVAQIAGREVDARAAAALALKLYEEKGNSVSAALLSARLRTPEAFALGRARSGPL